MYFFFSYGYSFFMTLMWLHSIVPAMVVYFDLASDLYGLYYMCKDTTWGGLCDLIEHSFRFIRD